MRDLIFYLLAQVQLEKNADNAERIAEDNKSMLELVNQVIENGTVFGLLVLVICCVAYFIWKEWPRKELQHAATISEIQKNAQTVIADARKETAEARMDYLKNLTEIRTDNKEYIAFLHDQNKATISEIKLIAEKVSQLDNTQRTFTTTLQRFIDRAELEEKVRNSKGG